MKRHVPKRIMAIVAAAALVISALFALLQTI